jgi:hypothetical protein
MSGQQIDPKVARYLADIADALEGLASRDCGYGEFYISGVKIAYEGDESGVELFPDEFGGLAIRVSGNPA